MNGPEIFIISKSGDSRETLLGYLSVLRNEFKNIRIEGMGATDENPKFSELTRVVILDTDQSAESLAYSIEDFRKQGFNEPILVVGSYDTADLSKAPGSQQRVSYFRKPYEAAQLVNAVREIIYTPLLSGRKHTRHDTNVLANVRIKGELAGCTVRNLSKGGAYIELKKARNVRVGDEIVLCLNLDKSKCVYDLVSRVAWIDYESGAFGIEFGQLLDEELAA